MRTASGGIAHHQQVQLLVHEHVPGLGQGLDHVEGGLGVGVGQEEALHHQVLVLPLLGGNVGIDQHGVLVEDLPVELACAQQHVHGIGDGRIPGIDRDPGIGAHVLVEHEVEPGLAGQGIEHVAQAGVPEFQGNGSLEPGVQLHRFRARRLAGKFLRLLEQGAGRAIARFLGQNGAQFRAGGVEFPLLDQRLGFGQQGPVGLCRLHIGQAGLRPGIFRMQPQHFLVGDDGLVETLRLHGRLRLGQELPQHAFLGAQIGGPGLHIAGFIVHLLFQRLEPLLHAAFGHQLLAFQRRQVVGAGRHQAGAGQPEQVLVHGAILKVFC